MNKVVFTVHLVLPLIFCLAFFLTGCSSDDVTQKLKIDQQVINDVTSGSDTTSSIEAEKQYVDEKTGAAITEVQYNAYHVSDTFKKYGLYIAFPSFCLGLLIRCLVHSSASIRRFGLVLEIGIPFIYILLAYVMSAVADQL